MNLAEPRMSSLHTGMRWQTAGFRKAVLSALGGILILICGFSLATGSIAIGMGDLGGILLFRESMTETPEAAIIWSIRFPRLFLGLLLGASLAASGTLLQGMFRNPLADPALIGISGGAAVGAMAAILMGGSLLGGLSGSLLEWVLPLAAALGAIAAVTLVYRTSLIAGRVDVPTMLMAGIAINALAGAFLGVGVYLADNAQLREFTYWTLGSLSSATQERTLAAALFMGMPLLILPFLARKLNIMLLGSAEATHLGINVPVFRRTLVLLAAVLAGTGVALCGIVGFVGLLAPHGVRMLVGADHRWVLPGSMLMGASLTVFADLLARTVVSPAELPLGALTALAGGPFFFLLLWKRKHALVT